MKVAVVRLTWSAATEVGRQCKNVNVIAPGLMATGTTRVLGNEEAPAGRLVGPAGELLPPRVDARRCRCCNRPSVSAW